MANHEIPFSNAIYLSDPSLEGLADPTVETADDIIARLDRQPVNNQLFGPDSSLTYQEQTVLALRYGVDALDLEELMVSVRGVPTSFYELDDKVPKDPSLQAIADVLGVARDRIRTIESYGLGKSRSILSPHPSSRHRRTYY